MSGYWWCLLLPILALLLAVIAVVVLVGPRLLWNMTMPVWGASVGGMYPSAPSMPAVVSDSTEDLLEKYEAILAERAPHVLDALQPGLNESRIAELEKQHDFELSDDLRALYRWRNGTPRDVYFDALPVSLDAFPDHRFVPLEEAIALRDELVTELRKSRGLSRLLGGTVKHRVTWLAVFQDPAGDGYYFDPERSPAQGSFFFNFAEDGTYIFYPSARNYLAEIIEGFNADVYGVVEEAVTTRDFYAAQKLHERFGAAHQWQ